MANAVTKTFKGADTPETTLVATANSENSKAIKQGVEDKVEFMIPSALAGQLGAVDGKYYFAINETNYEVLVDDEYHKIPRVAMKHMQYVLKNLDKKPKIPTI